MNFILKVMEKVSNIIYPIKCVECNKISKQYLCKKCKARLDLKIETNIKVYKNKNFINHIYLFKYSDWIREKLIKYKFRNHTYLYRFFAEIIIEVNNQSKFLEKYDYIVPIPISRARKKERGYNQSELIANELARRIDSISVVKIISKKINNKVQSTLKQKEREENVKNVYEINRKEAVNLENNIDKKFLLIDDIFTTGSTSNECAKVLKKFGIKNVDIFTIAKD